MKKVHVYVEGKNFSANKFFRFREIPRAGDLISFFGNKGVNGLKDQTVKKIDHMMYIWKLFWIFPIKRHKIFLDVYVDTSMSFFFDEWDFTYLPDDILGGWFIKNKWKIRKVNREEKVEVA